MGSPWVIQVSLAEPAVGSERFFSKTSNIRDIFMIFQQQQQKYRITNAVLNVISKRPINGTLDTVSPFTEYPQRTWGEQEIGEQQTVEGGHGSRERQHSMKTWRKGFS